MSLHWEKGGTKCNQSINQSPSQSYLYTFLNKTPSEIIVSMVNSSNSVITVQPVF